MRSRASAVYREGIVAGLTRTVTDGPQIFRDPGGKIGSASVHPVMSTDIFQHIVESLNVGVMVLNRNGHVVFVNRTAQLLGTAGVTVDGRPPEEWARRVRESGAVAQATCGESSARVCARMLGDHRVVFIWTLARDPEILQQSLSKSYDLTPQEARLAVALYFRTSLEGAASDLGITMSTARTHLKNVFWKTGSCKQSQLVLLVATCAEAA